MPIPLQNPYSEKGTNRVCARISDADFIFFKTLYRADGSIDAVVSTLFKNLIDELRTIHTRTPLESAWYVDSPTYDIILDILRRRTSGQPSGQEGPRDVAGRTSSLRQMDGDPAQQRPDEKSSVAKRRRKSETKKDKDAAEGLDDLSSGVAD